MSEHEEWKRRVAREWNSSDEVQATSEPLGPPGDRDSPLPGGSLSHDEERL